MLATAWILAKKDLALYFRDRTALLLSLALPIVLATIFGAAMGGMMGGGGGMNPVKLLVEDRDGSEVSAKLVEALLGTESLRVVRVTDAQSEVEEGDAPAALVVPAGWGAALGSADASLLELLRDPAQGIEQQIIAGSIAPAVLSATWESLGQRLMRESLELFGFPPAGREAAVAVLDGTWVSMGAIVDELEESGRWSPEEGADDAGLGGGFDFANDLPELLGIATRDVVGEDSTPQAAGASHAISGVAVMMLLFSVVGAGGTLLEEQLEGTLQRLQLAPGAGGAILTGKLMVVGITALMQLLIMFIYGGLAFDVPVLRDPFALIVTSLALTFAASGLGMLFAVTCRTRKQLEGVSTLVILVMSAMGGSWFPLIATPAWFQTVGHFTLNAWAMDAYQGILWYEQGLSGVWVEVLVLLAIGGVLTSLSFIGYRRRFGAGS